jgi:hypothetical protein
MKKNILVAVVIFAVAAGVGFYGGMQYQKSRKITFSNFKNGQNQNFQTFGQGRMSGLAPSGAANGTKMMRGGGVVGEVTAKDNQSITVKTLDGSSKIVFYSSSSAVSLMASGSISDVTQGKQVFVSGTSNSDDSITAKTIELRPAPTPNQ